MPIYVYACPECELEIEEMRPIAHADAPMWCPVCGSACSRGITNVAAFARCSENTAQSVVTPAGQPLHRAGCACCTPIMRSKNTSRA